MALPLTGPGVMAIGNQEVWRKGAIHLIERPSPGRIGAIHLIVRPSPEF